MKRVKILQVITGLGTGGAEKVVFELCRHSLHSDIEIHLFSFGTKDDLLPLFKNEGINTDFIYAKNNFPGFIKIIKCLLKKIKNEKYDLIHAHLFHALVVAVIAKIRYPYIPICFTSHNTNLSSGHNKLSSAIRDIVVFILKPFRAVDIIFSKSQTRYIYKKNAVIIPNGIDTKKYKLHIPKNEIFTFLNIARFEDSKNHLGLIEIIKKISTPIPFQVLLVGDGYLRDPIQEKIEQNNLSNKIQLLGFREDIAELCNRSHAFILPSLWEGMPIVLLEAGSAALPVISTPVGSIPSIINNNNGYLVSEDKFAETMVYVMENYNEAVRKGLTLQKDIIETYNTSIMYEKHMQTYLSLIS